MQRSRAPHHFLLLAVTLAADAGAAEVFEMGVVEVEARADDAISRTTVESAGLNDFRRNDRPDVATAATLIPGVTLQSGGQRNERLLFLRGFDARQVPVFIDGIPVYVPYDGNIDLARFSSSGIARIDVTKSYTSLLYGANTLGGSVNLVTRKPKAAQEYDLRAVTELDAEGEYSSQTAEIYAGILRDRWYAQATATGINRDHFRVADDFKPVATENGGERENSQSEDYAVQLRLGLTPRGSDEYSLSYYNQQGEKGSPPYAGARPDLQPPRFWLWPEYDKQSLYFISQTALPAQSELKLRAYWDKFDNTLQSFDDASYTTRTRGFAFESIYDDYTLGGGAELGTRYFSGHDLRASFSYKLDVHRETDNPGFPEEKFKEATLAAAVEDRYALTSDWALGMGVGWQRQDVQEADNLITRTVSGRQVPVRVEDFATSDSEAVNVQFGAFHELSSDTTAHATIARRTRFATIKDRYSYRLGFAAPNPDLKAEDALHFELGLSGVVWGVDYSSRFYVAQIDDSIQEVIVDRTLCQPPRTGCTQLQNVGESTHRGLELSLSVPLEHGWLAHTQYSLLDRDNRSRPDLRPTNTPEHSVYAALERSGEVLDAIASLQYDSERISRSDGRLVADGFVIGNLKGIWHALPQLDLEASVLNVGDADYAYIEGFPEPGRRFLLGVHTQF
jgi:iron complex outermembrane recepter protein